MQRLEIEASMQSTAFALGLNKNRRCPLEHRGELGDQ